MKTDTALSERECKVLDALCNNQSMFFSICCLLLLFKAHILSRLKSEGDNIKIRSRGLVHAQK